MTTSEPHTDFNWLVEHSRELYEKYRGKWIAVCECEVVGCGDTAVEASRQAEERRPGKRHVLHAVEHDSDAIYSPIPMA